jgi:hypothetical protein
MFILLSDTLKLNNAQVNVIAPVNLPLTGNSEYTIFIQPKWLSFTTMHGTLSEGKALLSFKINPDNISGLFLPTYGIVSLDIENIGIFSFIVEYADLRAESPGFQCSTNSIDFNSTDNQSFTITNTNAGVLDWKINSIPDWLIISETSGTLSGGNSITINATLDKEKIPANRSFQ